MTTTGVQTKKYLNDCRLMAVCTHPLHQNPYSALIAINTTEVGVAVFFLFKVNQTECDHNQHRHQQKRYTFSETLKRRVSMVNEQISMPLPVIPEQIPPIKPPRMSTRACCSVSSVVEQRMMVRTENPNQHYVDGHFVIQRTFQLMVASNLLILKEQSTPRSQSGILSNTTRSERRLRRKRLSANENQIEQ